MIWSRLWFQPHYASLEERDAASAHRDQSTSHCRLSSLFLWASHCPITHTATAATKEEDDEEDAPATVVSATRFARKIPRIPNKRAKRWLSHGGLDTQARLPALGGQTFHNNGFTLGQLAVSTNKRNAAQGPSRCDFFFPQSTPLAAITARHNNDNRHHQVGRYANVVPWPTARTRAHVHARTSLLQPHLDGEAVPACFTHARTPWAGIIDRVAKSFHARTAAPSSTYIIIITAPRGLSCTLALSLADRPASVHGLSHTDSTFLNTGVSLMGEGWGGGRHMAFKT